MSALTKFPTKSRMIMFEKNDNGRWLCDGRFAFFCNKAYLTNTELQMEASVYEKFKGDFIKTLDALPDFNRITQRVSNCIRKAEFVTFNEGMLIARFDDRFPDEIKGDNYILKYVIDDAGTTQHLYVPEKLHEYLGTYVDNIVNFFHFLIINKVTHTFINF